MSILVGVGSGVHLLFCLSSMNLRLDTLKQTVLDVIQDGVVLDNGQVLRLSLELLVGVLARAAHGVHRHLLRGHLLSHLACG